MNVERDLAKQNQSLYTDYDHYEEHFICFAWVYVLAPVYVTNEPRYHIILLIKIIVAIIVITIKS